MKFIFQLVVISLNPLTESVGTLASAVTVPAAILADQNKCPRTQNGIPSATLIGQFHVHFITNGMKTVISLV